MWNSNIGSGGMLNDQQTKSTGHWTTLENTRYIEFILANEFMFAEKT